MNEVVVGINMKIKNTLIASVLALSLTFLEVSAADTQLTPRVEED